MRQLPHTIPTVGTRQDREKKEGVGTSKLKILKVISDISKRENSICYFDIYRTLGNLNTN